MSSLFLSVLLTTGVLRVCSDPNNMPFSNRAGDGFENRIAEVLAGDLHARVQYVWWSQRRNYVRNTLNAGRCDVVIGMPAGIESALTTAPYYRSTYVFVFRPNGPIRVHSLFDPPLQSARLAVEHTDEDYIPPVAALARHGIHPKLVPFSVFGAAGEQNPPARLIDAVERGDVDVGIAWGPLAGYFAAREPKPLAVVPISPVRDGPIPFTFAISAAVRRGNVQLREQLDRALTRHHAEIRRILAEYHVPEAREP
jgi:mxaJ protein